MMIRKESCAIFAGEFWLYNIYDDFYQYRLDNEANRRFIQVTYTGTSWNHGIMELKREIRKADIGKWVL